MTRVKRLTSESGRGRFYQIGDGLLLPSVTSILQAVAKPALIHWAAKVEREACLRAAVDLWRDLLPVPKRMEPMVYETALVGRIGKLKAHQKELAAAGEIGNQVHALIEWNLRRELGLPVKAEPKIEDRALWAFMAFEDWRKQADLKPIGVERTVWSLHHGYAGTVDVDGMVTLPEHGRVRAVLDWKSGKAIYGEAWLQNAAYVRALREMEPAVTPVYGVIVRLPKIETDPGFEVRIITPEEHEILFLVFQSVMNLWRWQQDFADERAERPLGMVTGEAPSDGGRG